MWKRKIRHWREYFILLNSKRPQFHSYMFHSCPGSLHCWCNVTEISLGTVNRLRLRWRTSSPLNLNPLSPDLIVQVRNWKFVYWSVVSESMLNWYGCIWFKILNIFFQSEAHTKDSVSVQVMWRVIIQKKKKNLFHFFSHHQYYDLKCTHAAQWISLKSPIFLSSRPIVVIHKSFISPKWNVW